MAKRCIFAATIQRDPTVVTTFNPKVYPQRDTDDSREQTGAFVTEITPPHSRIFFRTTVYSSSGFSTIPTILRNVLKQLKNGHPLNTSLASDRTSWSSPHESSKKEVTIAYNIFGPNGEMISEIPKGKESDCVLIFHPLSSGPNAMKYFKNAILELTAKGKIVVVPNTLDSCHGSSGISHDTFAQLQSGQEITAGINTDTVLDAQTNARALNELKKALIGDNKWDQIIGASMGGRTASIYSSMYPQSSKVLTIVASDIYPSCTQERWSKNALAIALQNRSFFMGRYIQEAFRKFDGNLNLALNILVDPESKETLEELRLALENKDSRLSNIIKIISKSDPVPHDEIRLDLLNKINLYLNGDTSLAPQDKDLIDSILNEYVKKIQTIFTKNRQLLNQIRRTDNDLFESAPKIVLEGKAFTKQALELIKTDEITSSFFKNLSNTEIISNLISIANKKLEGIQLSEVEEKALQISIDSVTTILKDKGFLSIEDIKGTPYELKKIESIKDDDWLELVDYLMMHMIFSFSDMSNIHLKNFPDKVIIVKCKDDLLVDSKSQEKLVSELENVGKNVYVLEVDSNEILKALSQADDITKVLATEFFSKNGQLIKPKQYSCGHDSFLISATDALVANLSNLIADGKNIDKYLKPRQNSTSFDVDTAALAQDYVPELVKILNATIAPKAPCLV